MKEWKEDFNLKAKTKVRFPNFSVCIGLSEPDAEHFCCSNKICKFGCHSGRFVKRGQQKQAKITNQKCFACHQSPVVRPEFVGRARISNVRNVWMCFEEIANFNFFMLRLTIMLPIKKRQALPAVNRSGEHRSPTDSQMKFWLPRCTEVASHDQLSTLV